MTTIAHPALDRRADAEQKSLHVVYGVLSLDLGGLERLVLQLAQECRQRGHRASVICIERRGRLAEEAEAAGIEVHSLSKPPGRTTQTISQAEKLLADLQPDTIHTHQIGALWYLGQAARRLQLPVLHTEHTDHVACARGWLAKLRARLLWRRASPLAQRFCCVSEDIARSARRWQTVARSRVDVVPNGIDLAACAALPPTTSAEVRTALGIPPGSLVIGTVGRLAEVKRQDLLIRAFAALRSQGKHASTRLLIVGDGPERASLEALAQTLGVGKQTIFAGYQASPERFLKAMDLFVLTSRHEGLPLALLEAWACSLAVVSSAVGAIPDTVIHGISGMLFPSGDVAALTQSLDFLLETPWIVNQLGRRGKARVEHRYSLTRMADEYQARYRALIAK